MWRGGWKGARFYIDLYSFHFGTLYELTASARFDAIYQMSMDYISDQYFNQGRNTEW